MCTNRLRAFIAGVALSLAGNVVAAAESDNGAVVLDIKQMLAIESARAKLVMQDQLIDAQRRTGIKLQRAQASDCPVAPPEPAEGAHAPAKAISVPPTQVEVVGIFGLGDNLFADVQFNGRAVRYQRGQALALGATTEFPYQLVKIQSPCVTLKEREKGENTYCLRRY